MNPQDNYPAIMAYIHERSDHDEKTAWNTLRADDAAAIEGGHAEVVQELADTPGVAI